MTSTSFFLTLALCVLAVPSMAETNWTATGPRGGTSVGTASCAKGESSLTCQRDVTRTAPDGQVATTQSTGTATRNGGTRVTTTTLPSGETKTRSRVWSR
jgi:hypothetical protein